MEDQTLHKPFGLLTSQQRKTEALRNANKPLPALISRRMFIATGVIGTVSVSISRPNIMAIQTERADSKWKSFHLYMGVAAGLMGYHPATDLDTDFSSAVRARDPQQAAAILAEVEFLRGRKYLDPLLTSWPLMTQDGRMAFSFLHSDGLNGVVSYLLGNVVFARLAGTTMGSIPGVHKILRSLGFTQKELTGLLSPKEQLVSAFSKFDNSDLSEKESDKYRSDGDAILRFFYRNTGRGTGQVDFVMENVTDPITRTKKFIESVVLVRYET
jgi:hypothetical protein